MTDGTEHGEKGQEEGPEAASVETGDEIERCPICLNPLLQRDLATPAGCGHVFCLTCILKWAEMVPSCPVDRRPFSVVYVQNSVLGSVKIPVKIKAIQAELQKIHSNRETEKGRGSMLRSQAPKNLEVTSHAKVKDDFKRKCNGYKCRQDTTELRKKKGRGELCSPRHPWSSSLAAGQFSALTQCLAEFVDVYEEEPTVHRKRCRLEVQERHRLPLATAVADSGLSCLPISPRPYEMIDGDPITTMQHEAGRFAFQGTVCAVTCTKGEEKKGSRATGSKGAKGKAQTTPTRCSIRNSRAVELSPAQDPGSPQSGHSDSNSSAPDSPPKASGAPRGNKKQAGKRKAKQAPRQKPGAKRNARSRRKAAPELQSSPEESDGGASEKDGEEESGKEAERREPGTPDPEENVADASGRHADGDSDHEDEGPGSAGSEDEQDAKNGSSPDGTEAVYRNDSTPPSLEERELEREEMEDLEAREKPVLSSDGECSPTPDCGEEGNASHGETPEKSDSPTSLDEEVVNGEREDQPADGLQMDAAEESSGTDSKVEAIELSQDAHSGCGPSESWKPISAPPTSNSPQESSESIAGTFPGAKVSESLGSDETNKEGFEDNTEMVPMDCDLPGSDQDELKDDQEKTQTPPHPASVSQAPDEGPRPERKPLGEASVGAEAKEQAAGRHRRSRFHSATTTWSPKRESEREQQRSRSRSRDNSGNSRESRGERNRSRSCSRDGNSSSSSRYKPRASSRDGEGDRDAPKGEDYRRSRNRERTSRRRSRTRSRSRSQSRSRSRTRTYGRGSPSDRAEPGGQSPRRRDRWSNDSRRNPRGNYQSRAHNQDKQSGYAGKEGDDSGNGGFGENSPERGRAENPDWVKEKVKADSEARGKPQWEEDRKNGPGDSWTRSANQGGWNSDRSRGAGRGQRGDFRRGDASQNRWQSRNSFSGTTNNSGNDSYSRFNENRGNRREGGVDFPEPPMDRSGWSTASSWAVCRTLPADVQNYYSRRGRNSATSGGGWNRPEEEKPAQGPPQSDPNPLSGGEGPPPPLNVVLPRPGGLLPFPVGAHAPPAPFAVPSQVPVYLHSTAPLLQGPPAASQGLPPPPPPPPPMQQVDCQLLQQAVSGGKVGPHLLSSLTKAPGTSFTLPSSTTQPRIAERLATSMELEAHVDSSKKEKKLQIKERAVHEVKMAIKPYYQSKDITKDEYKEIVRKAVEKICHSKSGEVNSGKVANLVKAYVDKYKHDRKNKSDDHNKC